ncbi:hypothetical protein [Nostoc sp. C117]|uniref:hypothetical protein n=1 Tax=Nostoc sp. C117 TaxID=3349875 RepID=UPI00370DBBB3
MLDLLKIVQTTPIPLILILAGIFFILLRFANKIGGFIEIDPSQRQWTLPIGLFLLTIGLLLNFASTRPSTPSTITPITSTPSTITPITSTPSTITPITSTRPISLPENSNILIYNASNDDRAHEDLKKHLLRLFPSLTVDAYLQWNGKWIMSKTRIYFLKSEYEKIAKDLIDWLPGDQDIIDYYDQLDNPRYFKDKPSGSLTQMIKIDKERDLLFFIGEDYEVVNTAFSKLR